MTFRSHRKRSVRLFVLTVLTALAALGLSAASATAAEPVIGVTEAVPDQVTPGKPMAMFVVVHNDGDAPMTGNLTLRYTLDSGFSIGPPEAQESPEALCTEAGQEVQCTIDVTGIPPDRVMQYKIFSFVDPGATGTLGGEVEVSGGGAPNTITVPLSFDTGPPGSFHFERFDARITDNPAQAPAQAGSHPEEAASTAEFYSRSVTALGIPFLTFISPIESIRNVTAHLPAGFVGNPTATAARCTVGQLSTPDLGGPNSQVPTCPRDSQIGVALVNGKDVSPIYNVVPPAGVPAEFGLYYQGVTVNILAKLRPSDNGVDLYSVNTPTTNKLPVFELAFWGNPSDSSHDSLRAECTTTLLGASGNLCPLASTNEEPFVRLPTSCSGASLPWVMETDTYEHPGVMHRRETTTPALVGCDKVPFEPRISVAPTSSSAHGTSGLDVDLAVPQDSGANGIANADVRQAKVTLPQGVSLNPAAAEGLEACSDGQLRLDLAGPAACPEASKLGTVEVDTPLLEETLGGSVYLRTQSSQDPESGEMYRLAIVLHSAQRGVDVKLPGSLMVDKDTGQLTTTFSDLPQLPFETMHLHLKGGPRAPLTTPQACGNYAAKATLTGWNGKTVSLEPSFSVDQGCGQPAFAPGFQAGVANPTAGSYSPFTLRVTRDAGQPNLSRIEATLPEGVLAKLAGVPVCSDAQAASCPASSRIGSVIAGVGEGTSPLYLPQAGRAPTAVYFAGPYKGAPYSVIASVPAQSGPFDLGTVLVRSALRIDPQTTQVSVESDPLPQIFGGIPVAYRDVRVNIDRAGYTLNPTDCEPKEVTGTIGSITGGSAAVSDRFQVSDCAALGFKPRLSISLRGKTRRAGNPALTAVLRMPQKGANANVSRAVVSLPVSEFLAQDHIQTVCTRVQYAAGAGGGAECPKGSVYGRARAFTPLLDYPLEGPVYLRSNGGERELPDLVASLGGQIHVDLVGYIDSNKKTGGIRTTFARVPDAPVSKFVLKMPGGRKSLLENSTNICRGTHRAVVNMTGQNGRIARSNPKVRVTGCGGER